MSGPHATHACHARMHARTRHACMHVCSPRTHARMLSAWRDQGVRRMKQQRHARHACTSRPHTRHARTNATRSRMHAHALHARTHAHATHACTQAHAKYARMHARHARTHAACSPRTHACTPAPRTHHARSPRTHTRHVRGAAGVRVCVCVCAPRCVWLASGLVLCCGLLWRWLSDCAWQGMSLSKSVLNWYSRL